MKFTSDHLYYADEYCYKFKINKRVTEYFNQVSTIQNDGLIKFALG